MSAQQSGIPSSSMTNTGGVSGAGGGDNLLEALVGEGKKYKTVGDLAKSRLEADLFIDQLKTENKAYREALLSGDTEALTKLESTSSQRGEGSPTTRKDNQAASQSITKEDVLSLVEERERNRVFEANRSHVEETLAKLYKDKAGEFKANRLGELGLDSETFQAMVDKSPKAALNLLGIREGLSKEGQQGVSKGAAAVNSEAYFANSGNNTENWSYWQKVRKELGQGYFKPEVQKQVFAARQKLGNDFWK